MPSEEHADTQNTVVVSSQKGKARTWVVVIGVLLTLSGWGAIIGLPLIIAEVKTGGRPLEYKFFRGGTPEYPVRPWVVVLGVLLSLTCIGAVIGIPLLIVEDRCREKIPWFSNVQNRIGWRVVLGALVLVVAFWTYVQVDGARQERLQAESNIQQGVEALARGNYQEAIQSFSAVEERNPLYATAQEKLREANRLKAIKDYDRGMAALKAGNYADAKQYLEAAKSNPDVRVRASDGLVTVSREFERAMLAGAKTLWEQGKYKLAIAKVREMLKACPQSKAGAQLLARYEEAKQRMDAEAAEREAERAAIAEAEKEERARQDAEVEARHYTESCDALSYEDIARNPEAHLFTNVVFTGKVLQTVESGNNLAIRVAVTQSSGGGWDDPLFVNYTRSFGEPRILEDDVIRFWGRLKGLKTYESIFGQDITVPEVDAKYVQDMGRDS